VAHRRATKIDSRQTIDFVSKVEIAFPLCVVLTVWLVCQRFPKMIQNHYYFSVHDKKY